jgi:hypothetical protein
MKVAVKEE